MLHLSTSELEGLRDLMRRAPTPHVRIKATALWNLARGKRRAEVADLLGVSLGSLSAWKRRFLASGVAGLAVRPGRGRKRQAQESEVHEYLRQSPRVFGLPQTRWTLRALAQTVPSLQGFSEAGVWKVLNRAGVRYKRGQPAVHSPDPEYGEKGGSWSKRSKRRSSALGR